MFLDKYLTEYDDSLSNESYIDPIGTLVIWSAYGQQIFKNRVNSISNDVRNYTLNLFNHYLTRRLIQDDSVVLSKRLTSLYGGKDTLFFKYASLLYLENLFVFSILKHEGAKAIESSGVLGVSKGRRLWNEKKDNLQLLFSHGKRGQILVRQLSLGVSGRYKTPLMEIGYFDNNYHYHLPSAAPLWEGAEAFITAKPLHKLAEMLIEHFKTLLSQNRELPETVFKDLPDELHKTFAQTFASPQAVGSYARDYWLSVTGLDSGAAGALMQVLDANAQRTHPNSLSAQQMITSALGKALPPEERVKMKHIEQLEPFLADAMLLFTLLASKKSQPLTAVVAAWERFNRDAHTLALAAQRLRDNLHLLRVVEGTAKSRLTALLRLADAATVVEQCKILIEYHNKVMAGRGQSPWLTLEEGERIRLNVRPMTMPSVDKWPNGKWFNTYYLPQFKWLVSGYQGVVV